MSEADLWARLRAPRDDADGFGSMKADAFCMRIVVVCSLKFMTFSAGSGRAFCHGEPTAPRTASHLAPVICMRRLRARGKGGRTSARSSTNFGALRGVVGFGVIGGRKHPIARFARSSSECRHCAGCANLKQTVWKRLRLSSDTSPELVLAIFSPFCAGFRLGRRDRRLHGPTGPISRLL